ncbi:MAG: SUMF1/EgtB/PvdO family nonheme iron enzyme, partial [Candidatus Aminicenantes bacterium]|nr:SUMF1/EgtB/PvdO family nonheme iron enzyme [Candidatus Aminicenantes bacterium]
EDKNAIDRGVELLEQLSLVQVRENRRLFLHPLLRQYALEKLPKFKGDAAYKAMAGYYIDMVKKNPQALHYEWQNALPFVDWCLTHSREKDSLLLIKKIDRFLYETGRWTCREEWLKKGIDLSNRLEDVYNLYDFTVRARDLYSRQGRKTEKRDVSVTLSDYCRRFKQLEVNIPWINYLSAHSFLDYHEMEQAYYINLQNMKESLFYGKKEEIGAIYKNLGNICRMSGLLQEALRFYKANLAIKEKFDTLKVNKIMAVGDVCDIYLDLKKFTEALEWLERYESELVENPHKELEALLYERYFFYYLETGDTCSTQDYLNKLKDAITDFGSVTAPAKLIYYDALLDKAAGQYQKAISNFEKAAQLYRDIGMEDETGKCFLGMGACFVKLGNNRKAREYLQQAGDIFKKYRIGPKSRCEQEAYYALVEARSAYDEQAVRLITRAKNTYRFMGVEDLKDFEEIEAEIRRETGDDRFNALLKQLKESGKADEIIDFGAGFLQVDPGHKHIVSPIDGREMVLIPSGFIDSPYYGYPLYLYPYYMDKYPVTNSDYKKFVDAMEMETPPHWPGGRIPAGMEDHPVVGINYDEALAYAQWAGKDLPLKEEWEIAAGIAGQKMIKEDNEEKDIFLKGSIYDENKEQQKIFTKIPLNIQTHPITQGKGISSPFGVCDLLGNIFEDTLSFKTSSWGAEYKFLKGFSWLRPSLNEKNDITNDHYSYSFQRWADVGFRCVKRVFRKEEAQRFIASGDKPVDWESRWHYDRAQYVFDTLNFLLYDGPKEPLIAKGISHCRSLLRLSPGHKRAVYLSTMFGLYPDDLGTIKDFFDSVLYPLLEKEKEAASFNFSRVQEILSTISALGKGKAGVARGKKLD